MRTIKFRGKTPDGIWVYGQYAGEFDNSNMGGFRGALILAPYATIVEPLTVGQFTGVTEKYGNKIYEGDILQEIGSGKTVLVVYEAPQFCYADNSFGYKLLNLPENYTVIGNIHDNPELLKGGTL